MVTCNLSLLFFIIFVLQSFIAFQHVFHLPFQNIVYFDVASYYGDDWAKEDLTVEDGVVEVRGLQWCHTQ